MCGIFGVVLSENQVYPKGFFEKALSILARESQSRGKDSSGLVFQDHRDANFHVFKGAIPLDELLKSTLVSSYIKGLQKAQVSDPDHLSLAIGHSRLVTNGSQLTDANNQPVIKDGIIGIHNGIIVNDSALWFENPNLKREYEIDTEVFLALVSSHLQANNSIPEAIRKSSVVIEGTVSAALIVPERNALTLFTNNGSLYILTDAKGALFFASESFPLKVLVERFQLEEAQGYILRQLKSHTGIVYYLDDFLMQSFDMCGEDISSPMISTNDGSRIKVHQISDGKPQLELVSDVSVIAKAPEAKRYEAMLEYNHERVAHLRRCSKCLLPETFPFIEYDYKGECNYCRNYKIRNSPKPIDELLALIEPYRSRNGSPDCIVPFSGGRDSTYALHVIKTELGLNPIAFTYDWGMVTDLGRRNIARVCGRLGVENIIVAADIRWKRSNIKKNINAWLRKPELGMIPLFMAGDKYFYYYIDQVKRQTGICLNLWGINPMENTDFKVGFLGVAPDFDKKHIYSLSISRQLKLIQGVSNAVLSNPRYMNSSIPDTLGSFLSRSVKKHRDYFHLYDYLHWEEKKIDGILFDEYKWEKAIDTDTTWRIGDGTAAFYNYVYFNVAGFSEHDTFRSNQIREGVMSREEGLSLINNENMPRYPTIKWYLDAVGVDYQMAISTINKISKLYN